MIQTQERAISADDPNSTPSTSLNGGSSPDQHAPAVVRPSVGQSKAAASRRRKWAGLGLVVLVGAATGAAGWANPRPFRDALSVLTRPKHPEHSGTPTHFEPPMVSSDGVLTLGDKAAAGMGLETARVVVQTKPIRLELLGTTEYDSDNQTRIRPLFKGRVDKVYAKVGQLVSKGEPLIEYYSTDLAEAKNACEIERIQWVFYHNLLNVRENLAKSNAISRQSFLETQNEETKSLREYEVARDKLLVYGLTDEEVARVKDEVGGAEGSNDVPLAGERHRDHPRRRSGQYL